MEWNGKKFCFLLTPAFVFNVKRQSTIAGVYQLVSAFFTTRTTK